jgi:hypothetical protein
MKLKTIIKANPTNALIAQMNTLLHIQDKSILKANIQTYGRKAKRRNKYINASVACLILIRPASTAINENVKH